MLAVFRGLNHEDGEDGIVRRDPEGGSHHAAQKKSPTLPAVGDLPGSVRTAKPSPKPCPGQSNGWLRFTLAPTVELTYNWDPEVYPAAATSAISPTRSTTSTRPAQRLQDAGVTINRPPRDGHMAFVRSPDVISIELLQKGGSLPPAEPWASMPNTGVW